jgi:calcium-dependent protein kinase|mmetsp:Transcript_35560/g.6404  ORF Transcript_35560/g.6404 Transcript_35560/m.6404 type:complete len:89 (-) Transcript_35560:737-1003(-)
MHSHNIIHRDLKLENIVLEDFKEGIFIKIIDFGTGAFFNRKVNLSRKVGSVGYLAPEVIKGQYNEKCDLWSCGVILYILLVGVMPFPG